MSGLTAIMEEKGYESRTDVPGLSLLESAGRFCDHIDLAVGPYE